MPNLSLKQKIILVILAIGAALIAIFAHGLYQPSPANLTSNSTPVNQQADSEPKIVSTNPSPLDGATVLPSQTIEITFNLPLQNKDEFKLKIDPKVDFQVKLSDNRQTAQISFPKPLELGKVFSLTVGPDTKFDGAKNLGQDLNFQIKTIDYHGA